MKFVLEKHALNEPVALATLINRTGGSPRPIGTQMAFTKGEMTGFFSGGCVEADVAFHARATLSHGRPQVLTYGEESKFRDIKLQCGASITVAIEKLLPSDEAVKNYARLRQTRKQVIWISDGVQRYAASNISDFDLAQQNVAHIALSSPKEGGQIDNLIYWVRHRPRVRLILIGSDPTTLAIALLAKEAEFEVILVRRSGPAVPPPVGVDLYSRRAPETVFEEIGLDDRTAVVFADHDFEANRHLVVSALRSPAGYVGMVGAKRQRMVKEDFLRLAGLGDQDIARFSSPIGLHLGKSTPVSIAISAVAEIINIIG